MIQHLPDLTRPETEIERIIREIRPEQPDHLSQPVQVPGFRDPNDPRIPTALRQAAINRVRTVSGFRPAAPSSPSADAASCEVVGSGVSGWRSHGQQPAAGAKRP